jgi:hypothetical protein
LKWRTSDFVTLRFTRRNLDCKMDKLINFENLTGDL